MSSPKSTVGLFKSFGFSPTTQNANQSRSLTHRQSATARKLVDAPSSTSDVTTPSTAKYHKRIVIFAHNDRGMSKQDIQSHPQSVLAFQIITSFDKPFHCVHLLIHWYIITKLTTHQKHMQYHTVILRPSLIFNDLRHCPSVF